MKLIIKVSKPIVGLICNGCMSALAFVSKKYKDRLMEGTALRQFADDVDTINKRFHLVHQHKLIVYVNKAEDIMEVYRREDFVAMLETRHGAGYALLAELEARQNTDCLYIEDGQL